MLSFDDIRGQDDAIGFLRTARAKGRLPHALLFAGREGVGKKTTAEALAALVLCHKPKGDRPCGVCDSCNAMAAGTHPDYHLVQRKLRRLQVKEAVAKDFSIEVVREFILGPAGLSAQYNHGKVFVVDEVELMNASAQNAMLKTLEEPAKGTVIILLSSRPGDLLPTILSRCQMVRFSSLPAELIEKELRVRDVPAEEARQAAELADGSLGQALLWSKEGVVGRAAEMGRKLRAALAGGERFAIGEEIKSAADAQGEIELKKDEKASKDQAVREAVVLYLDLAARQVRGVLAETADGIAKERLCDLIELIAEVADQVEANVNVVLALRRLELRLGSG